MQKKDDNKIIELKVKTKSLKFQSFLSSELLLSSLLKYSFFKVWNPEVVEMERIAQLRIVFGGTRIGFSGQDELDNYEK